YLTLGFLLIFAGFVGHRIVGLFFGKSGKLQGRFITYFGLMAVVPVIVLALFSGFILERGMKNWFSDPVRTTLNNSLEVAEAYLDEHRMVIQGDVLAMAYDINSQALNVAQNTRFLQLLVEDQMAKRSLDEAVVFDGSGTVLSEASTRFSLSSSRVSRDILDRAQTGELILVSNTDEDRVKAYLKLDAYADAYLYVSRFVDPRVLGHLETTRVAFSEYEALEQDRSNLQLSFELVFGVLAFFLLLVAIWVGFLVAGSMTTPISNLADAAEKVGQGKFRTQLPTSTAKDEIGTLSRAFSRMTRKLESQQKDLKTKNIQLDERRRFTEAVLSGVSAGVIGLDKRGNINLPNRSACNFFGKSAKALEGKRFLTLMPELKPLLCRVMEAGDDAAQGQVTVKLAGKERTLLVRIAAEINNSIIGGYVITFDDITDQLSDQRTAAWADVARRIAHEIKNPLTPIQLSAERLKRKYAKTLPEDDPVFEQCTETIIRQVGDLRRMVDEFSSFARMPKPIFREESLNAIVKRALFLQEVASPNIIFKLGIPKDDILIGCDSRQISQAMTNILKNAAESISERASNDGKKTNGENIGHINITLKKSNGFADIMVEDDGSGFPDGQVEKLVEPYVTTREKGTGLGLAIVRKIMEDHKGQIKLSSRERGQGAMVTLSFDLKAKRTNMADGQPNQGRETTSGNGKEKVSRHGA
ncbi:MAG: PAS domain-containing sensor histidine kinase, partial [Sphingomonadales bacterium]